MDEILINAFCVLALNELCSYIDLNGNPVICDWKAYKSYTENELIRYRLTEEQFDAIKNFIINKYRGKL